MPKSIPIRHCFDGYPNNSLQMSNWKYSQRSSARNYELHTFLCGQRQRGVLARDLVLLQIGQHPPLTVLLTSVQTLTTSLSWPPSLPTPTALAS